MIAPEAKVNRRALVAQTCLSAVSQAFSLQGVGNFNARLTCKRAADKNVGDTADRNVCATVVA